MDEARPVEHLSASPKRVLVVEDDDRMRVSLASSLRRNGFDVDEARDGSSGLQRMVASSYDVMLLDLMLPGLDGFAVLEQLQSRVGVPVIVLSARSGLTDRLAAFSHGAVDFVAKPFWIEEIVARIEARLCSARWTPRRKIVLHDVVVDLDARTVERDGRAVTLTPHEFNILAHLLERPARAVSRRQLSEFALPFGSERAERAVDVHVHRIRRKLGDAASYISTVWGVGYRYDQNGAPS